MQTIYLDISNKGVVPTVYAKQKEVGRKFAVILTDSGLPYIPVSGSAFSVWYKGASGEGNYTDIGEKSAFSLSGNKVEVEMIVQMLSAHGDGILCLTLNSPDGNQISSWNIPYMCEIVPGSESEKAEEYYTAFSKAVEELPYPDETLSIKGKAADATAVGEALAKKADISYTKKIGNPHNLLDNSDFRNPVNQRGKISSTTNAEYVIDRWFIGDIWTSGACRFHQYDGNIAFHQGIFQRVAIAKNRVVGKTFTLALHTPSGTYVMPIALPINVVNGQDYPKNDRGINGVLRYYDDMGCLEVRLESSGDTVCFWAALYEGEYTAETLPEYQPEGYGAELAECSRYYRRSWSGTISNKGAIGFMRGKNAGSAPAVNWDTPMRITPTVTLRTWAEEVEYQTGHVRDWGTGNAYKASPDYVSPHGFNVLVPNVGSDNTLYVFHYEASADL